MNEGDDWWAAGLCRDKPLEMFFDDIEVRDQDDKRAAIKAARAVCHDCPVRWQCAEDALTSEGSAPAGRFGIRGCLTPGQRRRLYRNGGLGRKDPRNVPLT